MADDYPQATAEQKLTIAQYFIMSSPIGEVHEVVKDVKALIADSALLTDDKLRGIMQEYNLQHMIFATAPNNQEVLVSSHGQIAANQYLDPATGKVLTFDHLTQTFTGETEQKQVLSDAIDSYRSAIEGVVKTYTEANFKPKKFAFAVYGTDDGNIIVCISSKNARLSSFWAGGIRSKYRLSVSHKGQVELTGSIKVNVHYFEDGNVQLHTDFNKKAHVDISDPATTAKSVGAAIEKIETDFYNNLENLYVDMHSQTFKAMRRFLPISGQTMKWDASLHSLASEVTK